MTEVDPRVGDRLQHVKEVAVLLCHRLGYPPVHAWARRADELVGNSRVALQAPAATGHQRPVS
eukprot:8703743-Pyramimonas_sp.AAC.1